MWLAQVAVKTLLTSELSSVTWRAHQSQRETIVVTRNLKSWTLCIVPGSDGEETQCQNPWQSIPVIWGRARPSTALQQKKYYIYYHKGGPPRYHWCFSSCLNYRLNNSGSDSQNLWIDAPIERSKRKNNRRWWLEAQEWRMIHNVWKTTDYLLKGRKPRDNKTRMCRVHSNGYDVDWCIRYTTVYLADKSEFSDEKVKVKTCNCRFKTAYLHCRIIAKHMFQGRNTCIINAKTLLNSNFTYLNSLIVKNMEMNNGVQTDSNI